MSKPEVIVQRIEQKRFKKSKPKDWKLSHYLSLKSFHGYTVPQSKATCHDLNFDEKCKCKDCKVWKENNLASSNILEYYCRDGKAE